MRAFLGALPALKAVKLALKALEQRDMRIAIQLDEVGQQKETPLQALLQRQAGWRPADLCVVPFHRVRSTLRSPI